MSRAGRGLLAGAVLAASLLGTGCNLTKIAVDKMVPVLEQTRDDFNRGTVVENARQSGPGLIALINGLVLASPENPELRLLQAELNFSYAFAFLEVSDPDWAIASYQKTQVAALIALADEDEDLAAELTKLALPALKERLADLDEDAVPALFWWAFARGAEINLDRGDTGKMADLGRVEAVMAWVVEHDETYYNAGPHLFLGMRYMSLPKSLGGKPEEGLKHFKRVREIVGEKHLFVKVLEAQFFAPSLAATPAGAKKDEILAAQRAAWDAFFKPLDAVIKAKIDVWPENAIMNALAKDRALALLRDPESNNVILPAGAKNPYAGDGGDGDGWGGDDDDDDKDDDGEW